MFPFRFLTMIIAIKNNKSTLANTTKTIIMVEESVSVGKVESCDGVASTAKLSKHSLENFGKFLFSVSKLQ